MEQTNKIIIIERKRERKKKKRQIARKQERKKENKYKQKNPKQPIKMEKRSVVCCISHSLATS
jgi:hypothetical protein